MARISARMRAILKLVAQLTVDQPLAWLRIGVLDAAGSPEEVAEAVRYAADHGWLKVGGDPPHSLAITEEGRALTVRHYGARKRQTPY
jgi:hypothetical protein